ncbi:TPA: hypothetical protein L6B08_28545 [Pseudomonas aeruginosa]|nr:hypothetical protein BH596_19360 [Pseudomonas aeruginosa]OPD67087.1 hypothetical protein AO882_32700 [Pseudomonas paraeruginosa]OPD70103.1 hypothetical protein AO898_29985 [Pseudomonas aeruginosa]OPD70614.1 hypothetical protein AO896_29875 [Pseudomonas aeruginosa]OPD86643.1 hypothetical protein AO955_31570 [Pseudomonas aeruginosa]
MGVAVPPPAFPAHHRAFPGAGRIRHRPGHVQKRRVRAWSGEPPWPPGVCTCAVAKCERARAALKTASAGRRQRPL